MTTFKDNLLTMTYTDQVGDYAVSNVLSQRVKSMQRSGTEAIRIQIQPSKPKWEIADITNSQNTERTNGQPTEQLSP